MITSMGALSIISAPSQFKQKDMNKHLIKQQK